jgi:DNA-binding GntR family transcriptional regulator
MPRRGAVVSKITRKEIDDFYELKSLLEGYAARIAAERINEKGIKKLKKINDQLIEMAENDDIDAFFLKNDEFHNVFISYCGNEKLLELLEHMVQRFMRFRLGALAVPGRLKKSVKQHDDIIKALARKDGALAEAKVLEHALLSGEELAEQVVKDVAL